MRNDSDYYIQKIILDHRKNNKTRTEQTSITENEEKKAIKIINESFENSTKSFRPGDFAVVQKLIDVYKHLSH